ncbi:adenylosuccinate synthetase [Corynebacterium sp. CCUG 70398]|uniref:adenylosuccinate synthetase n=1 Tax=Corynebacterium sp. CCUG 70398 TaxID=2823891 RepID=UPI002109E7AA|nr:adenylosuccinate synthetase [Corynebacterium sp. CCUG 70398]
MTVYANPGSEGSIVNFEKRYDHYIGGQWVAPADGEYFDNSTPVTGEVFCQVARGTQADIDRALDAAHKAAPEWGKTSAAERALILNRIADRMEEHLEEIAVAETWENGKAVRETLAADIPLAIDHFRYFAGAIRAQEGRLSQLDDDSVAYHFHEPLGVVGQIIPWNFPILMAVWKLAPALAAGNAVVMKPAEQTPASILYLMNIIGDLIPDGVVNIVNGFGDEAGVALTGSDRIAKIAFTGSTDVGKLINKSVAERIIPVTLELGGTYPFVTSSNPTAGGACVGSGIGPTQITGVLGIVKAYTTRVGAGPFPTELFDKWGDYLQEVGGEVGVNTGRKRRCGWYDAVIARYAARVNGFTDYFLTKLDVLTGIGEIPICVAYDVDGVRHDEMPLTQSEFHHAEPIFETMPAWDEDITGCRTFEELPQRAQDYVLRLEELSGAPMSYIGVGPGRDQTIVRNDIMER